MASNNKNNQENISYIANAFSTRMMSGDGDVHIRTITKEEFEKEVMNGYSIIGHQDTANVLGVPMNRESITLKEGDILYIAELKGGRLPEGATTLPEGFTFAYKKVWVEYVEAPLPENVERVDIIHDFNKRTHKVSYKTKGTYKRVSETFSYDELQKRLDSINKMGVPIISLEKTNDGLTDRDIHPVFELTNFRYNGVSDGGRFYDGALFDAHIGRYVIKDISSAFSEEEYFMAEFEKEYVSKVLMRDEETIKNVLDDLELDDDDYKVFVYEDNFINGEKIDIRSVIGDAFYEYDAQEAIKSFLLEAWNDDFYYNVIDRDY